MASVLTGEKGFVQSPDPATLRIAALPAAGDPAAPGFTAGAGIGLIGLDFTTRRRNRANGRLTAVDDGLTVRIAQSFGNCAQYIQTRAPTPRAVPPAPTESLDGLDDAARSMIASSDTFFVASRSRPEVGAQGGLDMSHRGGRPGFVGVQGDTLAIPDFRGNRFYNTLGNLLGDPRAGLIFIDFASGDLLQLQGRVTIDWHPDLESGAGPAGTERAVARRGRTRLAAPRRLPLRLALRRLRADDLEDRRVVSCLPRHAFLRRRATMASSASTSESTPKPAIMPIAASAASR